jgi:pimeloyl-ACP methyl ester carboxylesterase
LIGWSLGGVFAREMARRAPEQVRSVITLGSPFAGAPKASNAWKLYERASQRSVEDWPDRERMKTPPPVPSSAIFSRSDGIVAWQGCLEREGPTTRTSRSRAVTAARPQPDRAVRHRRSAGPA